MYYPSFFILIIAVSISIILLGFLLFQVYKLKKRLDVFLKRGDKSLEEVLRNQINESERQKREILKIFGDISRLNKVSQKSFQKMGIVRFNPFKGTGGDQSFSIVLLDANNDGFVITSYYDRDSNRVYAKPIIDGKSRYSLSREEEKVIIRAMNPKNEN